MQKWWESNQRNAIKLHSQLFELVIIIILLLNSFGLSVFHLCDQCTAPLKIRTRPMRIYAQDKRCYTNWFEFSMNSVALEFPLLWKFFNTNVFRTHWSIVEFTCGKSGANSFYSMYFAHVKFSGEFWPMSKTVWLWYMMAENAELILVCVLSPKYSRLYWNDFQWKNDLSFRINVVTVEMVSNGIVPLEYIRCRWNK